MSFQTFVTQRLAALTAQLNAIATNAKKIDELPVQSTLDPASKLHVSRGTVSESLEIQKIIDAITEKNYSQLLEVGEITVSGLNVIVPSAAMWVYEGVIYQTTSITTITETLCATGFLRKDILVANQSNQIVLVKGAESETIRIKPNIPLGTVLVTEIDVDDTVIGTPSTPILGDNFISKRETYPIAIAGGSGGTLISVLDEGSYFEIFDYDGDILNIEDIFGYIYPGKSIFIKNIGTANLTIVHDSISSTLNKKYFIFPNKTNFILKPNELIEFKLDRNERLNFLGIIKDITKAEIEAKLTGEITTHTHQIIDTISLAMSDSTTVLVTGDTDPLQAPYNFILVNYWVGVKTAPTVSSLIVDVKKNGTSITSTKAGINATEKTSLTGTSPVLTTTSFMKGDEITPNIYQVGSSETGRSLKLYLEIIKT